MALGRKSRAARVFAAGSSGDPTRVLRRARRSRKDRSKACRPFRPLARKTDAASARLSAGRMTVGSLHDGEPFLRELHEAVDEPGMEPLLRIHHRQMAYEARR